MNQRRGAIGLLSTLVIAAVTIEAFVLYEQRGSNPPRPYPDPDSPAFPADALVFPGPKGSWSCHWLAAVKNMLAERRKEPYKYSCRITKVTPVERKQP